MTTIYDLIILDESGSMSTLTAQTISGCNETMQTIQAAQEQNSDVQKHLVSVYAFQSGEVPSRYLIKNVPAEAAFGITRKDYKPNGCTPLYDAIGSCIADLKATIGDDKDSIGSITIITDGMENSSRRYSLGQVLRMIDAQKELGWEFHFIGANIDAKAVSQGLHIDNSLQFDATPDGMEEMWEHEKGMKLYYMQAMSMIDRDCSLSDEERLERRKEAARNINKKA
ncbi:MAG: hypothetical protein HUJ91_00235 [Bacteroidales bacterium]|nr:hypothetical protein [Bacteroidales bacterium]